MSSIVHSFQKRATASLPVSQSPANPPATDLRRRLSSLSLNLNLKPTYPSPPASWTSFYRSKSVSSIGANTTSSIKKWWRWGWSWILSRKPTFAQDLEMNEEESKLLGCHNKGSLKHVFYKLRSEIRKLGGSNNVGLPQTCKYTSFDYAKNFDDGSTKSHLGHH